MVGVVERRGQPEQFQVRLRRNRPRCLIASPHHFSKSAIMEVNKDEADRCLSIARKRYDSGDISGAIKFTKKSIALYSTPQAEALLANLNNSEASNSSTASEAGSSSTQAKATGAEAHPSAAGTSKRHHTTSASTSDGTSTPTKEYTEAQMKVVKRVRACKTVEYYEILELKKECTDEEIKKAYRKVSTFRLVLSWNIS